MRVAIDTNVFLHLLNPAHNGDSHIDQLLSHLAKHAFKLCVDSTDKIAKEYYEHLDSLLRRQDDTDLKLYILRFWMDGSIRDPIDVDARDQLMSRIREVIPGNRQQVDRAFVYVSYKGDCCLVTNCNAHILSRTTNLKKRTKKLRGKRSIILDSREAVPYFCDKNRDELAAFWD